MKKYALFSTLGFSVLIATLLLCVVYFSMFGDAKLSDETLEEVDKLRIKHMYHMGYLSSGTLSFTASSIDWDFVYDYTHVYFEDGKLFVETQDGTWFIEMERKEEK